VAERFDLVVRSRQAVTPEGEQPASVAVRGGVIAAVEPYEAELDAPRTVDSGEDALLPGLVDSHVHVNEPGRTEWEGFESATRAAAAGGITTLIDMPLNCVPPTISVAALEAKRKCAEGRCYVDVGFWGGLVPDNLCELAPLHAEGVFGFKCYLTDSGVVEFGYITDKELEPAVAELAALEALTIVHAEDQRTLELAPWAHGGDYSDFLASRPP
jgi:allantoinase